MMIRRMAWRILRAPLLALGASLLLLTGCQSRFIYFPNPYRADLDAVLPQQIAQIAYHTDEGRQVAFWLPPRAGGSPRQVWVCHAGNGSVALDWLDLAQKHPETDVGFLMVDYPGYGRCEGSSTPGRILANSEGAVAALAVHLAVTPEDLQGRVSALGHSLGAACALQYAAKHPVQRVVLVAPFTSMGDMADRTLFWPMHWFLWHRFDNRARLDELALRTPPPRVVILHGTLDEVIPIAMGRELAATHAPFTVLHEIPNGDHNGIMSSAREIISRCLMDDQAR